MPIAQADGTGGFVATTTLTEQDRRARDAVIRQLEWDPEVDASGIGVTAHQGAITLTGLIDTYAGKLAAERAAKRVHGVRAVANDLEVRLTIDRTDSDIAADATRALELHATLPAGIQASVRHGQVTLTGTAGSLFQVQQAEGAICHIRGVRNVINHVTVAPRAVVRDVRRRIVQALHQNADVDARQVTVTVDRDTARLTGTVSTWLQRDAAERAAAHAPGIARVENHIIVEPPDRAGFDDIDEVC